jgi:hypothetical protein
MERLMTIEIVEKKIFRQISLVMKDISAVDKTQQNHQQRFMFRGIDDVYNAVHKAMAKHEVFSTTELIKENRAEFQTPKGGTGFRTVNLYKFRFFTSDGSYIETFAQGEGIDYGDKLANKCVAIAHKYALLQLFCIPTKDMPDPDKESPVVEEKNPNGFNPSSTGHREFFKGVVRNAGIDPSKADSLMKKFEGATLKEIQEALGNRNAKDKPIRIDNAETTSK